MKNSYLYSALVSAVTMSIAHAESGSPQNNHEKCYGVAKAGENDCNGTDQYGEKQSCPGWSDKNNNPYAWSYVPRGTCLKKGGKYSPPPAPAPKAVEP